MRPHQLAVRVHHFSTLVVFLQKPREAKIAEGVEQRLIVAHVQKNSQAAGGTGEIEELLAGGRYEQLAAPLRLS